MVNAVWVRVPSLAPKKNTTLSGGVLFWFYARDGTRKPDPSVAKVQNSPVDCFVGRGRVLPISDASGTDVDGIGTFTYKPIPIRVSGFFAV